MTTLAVWRKTWDWMRLHALYNKVHFTQICFVTVPPGTEPSHRLRATCNYILCYVMTNSTPFYL
jgi:hypothetical protein